MKIPINCLAQYSITDFMIFTYAVTPPLQEEVLLNANKMLLFGNASFAERTACRNGFAATIPLAMTCDVRDLSTTIFSCSNLIRTANRTA